MKSTPKPTTIMIADDHAAVRQGLRALLRADGQFALVAEARNGGEAVALARKLDPDVILMDIAMPVLNGFEATRRILADDPAAKVVILSAHTDDEYIAGAYKAGAAGFVEKQSYAAGLTAAIREVAKGNLFFSPSGTKRLPRKLLHSRARSGSPTARLLA